MKVTNIALGLTCLMFGSFAQALPIAITPTTINGAACTATTCWSGSVPNNPDAADVQSIVGSSATLELLYKDNVGGIEEGTFLNHYDTEYFNTPLDPMDATITFTGGNSINCPECYLLLKDGNQDPVWYIFDIGFWDGTSALEMTGFWPNQGAISHVSIVGDNRNVPEPGILLLVAGGLLGIGARLRLKKTS